MTKLAEKQNVRLDFGEDGKLIDIGLSSLIAAGLLRCEVVKSEGNHIHIKLTLEMDSMVPTNLPSLPGMQWEEEVIRIKTIHLSRITVP